MKGILIPGLSQPDYAIDPGTAYTSIFIKGRGVISVVDDEETRDAPASHSEPEDDAENVDESLDWRKQKNFVIRSYTATPADNRKKIIAVGDRAFGMVGRSDPAQIRISRTVRDGRLRDDAALRDIIEFLLYKANKSYSVFKNTPSLTHTNTPRVVIPVACTTTPMERLYIKKMVMDDLKGDPYIVWQPIAAAIGANLNFLGSKAVIIVDIGGGTIDIAVLAFGHVRYYHSRAMGGDRMDQCLIDYFKKEHKLEISQGTAEALKIRMASALPLKKKLTGKIKGRPLPGKQTQDPIIDVDSDQVNHCLAPIFKEIVEYVKDTIMGLEGNVISDILDTEIALTGGGSLPKGFRKYLAMESGFKVKQVNPLLSVVIGAGAMLTNKKLLKMAQCVEMKYAN